MADSRALTHQLLADVSNLTKGLDKGATEVSSFGDKLGKFSKIAGAAFAAAGVAAAAYAGKLLVDGVKSAIEDEAAQAKLATTLQNVTGATTAQIKATEDYITKTTLATGITDDELRPSLDRLVRSTKDVEEAEKLQALALDISAGSGKSLAAVSEALAKAHDGNFAALKKLGVPLDESIIKSKDFDAAQKALAATFEGQSSVQADTFAGKMQRLSVAFNEGKETVGSFVLDAITPLVTLIVENVIPTISALADNIGTYLAPTFEKLMAFFQEVIIPIFTQWWGFIWDVVIPGIISTFSPILEGLFEAFGRIAGTIKDNEDNLKPLFNLFKAVASFVAKTLAPAIGEVLGTALKVVGVAISGLISGLSTVIGLVNGVVNAIKSLIALVAANPLVKGISNVISSAFGGGRASGGSVSNGTSYLVGERGPEIFTPNQSGSIIPNSKIGGMGGNTVINLNVSGAIDPEGTARAIINVLNNSSYRGTLGSGAFA
jgi:hypothetical protein